MKKLKFLLPVLAIIFAIGLAFATMKTNVKEYYATGFIQIGTAWYEVDVACVLNDEYPCLAQIQGETQQYQVYKDRNTSTPLESSTPDVKIVPDPR